MTYDIETIRKAYNKVQAAMTAAKEAGDTERLAQLKPDYMALKEMLTKAKAEQPASTPSTPSQSAQVEALQKELAAAQEEIAKLKTLVRDYRYDNERLRDENKTLRSPPPVEEYKKAQTLTQAPMPSYRLDEEELLREMDATFGPAV